MNPSYWRQQKPSQPLFPDIAWNRPERQGQAGRLGIVGGNKLSFAAVADAYQTALDTGVGQVRVLLPDVLKKTIPVHMTDVLFAPTNASGSLSAEAHNELRALGDWADMLLFIGDAGKNSQTATLYEQFAAHYDKPLLLTRDAIDLLSNSMPTLLDQPSLTMVASFAQAQKLFRTVYYPKMLTFSMQLAQFVDALHKFTVTYPITLAVFHADHLVVAHGGNVITQPWDTPMSIWRGLVAARAASYLLWTPRRPLEAVATSLLHDTIRD